LGKWYLLLIYDILLTVLKFTCIIIYPYCRGVFLVYQQTLGGPDENYWNVPHESFAELAVVKAQQIWNNFIDIFKLT